MSEEIADYKVDRTGWEPGPWDNEPDRFQWQHAGYACLITRDHEFGNLCGYVAVDRDSPLYNVHYRDVGHDLPGHGGVNYSNACNGHICHVPEPGMPDDVWWFGFDCGHFYDYQPGMTQYIKPDPEFRTYRDFSYVKQTCEELAEALRAIASK